MPPKYVRGRNKKPAGKAEPSKEEGPEEGTESTATGSDAPALAGAGAGTGGAADADATTVTGSVGTAAGSGAGDSVSVAGAGAGAAGPVDDYLTEALPGEEHHHRLMDEACKNVNITTSTYASKIHPNARDLKVSNLTVILKGKELLVDAELSLSYGCRYALVGPNGCGKSILMTIIGRRMVPLPKNLDVFHLQSEIEPSEMTAVEAVTAVDVERTRLTDDIASLEELITGEDTPEQEEINTRLFEMYERLEELGADTAEAKASVILHGLGFTKETMAKKCREFSGGWRMRIALARALFVHPTCLLLDEPTSHLDMEAVVWLERYLATYKGILLLVSHSQDFMNNVATDTVRMYKKRLDYFGGNYDTYIATREELEENQMKRFEKQQSDVAALKDFVARFGHGTKKMAQQAQSREKLLAKVMEEGAVEKVEREAVIRMRFPDPGTMPPPVLQLQNISFAYPGCELLYENVDFGVDLDSRIALVGPNGKGKTTMLKMMAGELVPVTGAVRPDLNMTPLEYFSSLMPDEPPQEVRKKLGRYGVSGENQAIKMAYLSNGIKSRVVFAKLALRTPHLMLLDEPTNGLDIETIDALAEAINEFKGGVVLVSHDMRLISQVAKDIYECDHRKVVRFPGDIAEYKALLEAKISAASAAFGDSFKKVAAAMGKK